MKISLFCATANPLKWEYPAKEFIEYHEPYVDEIVICDANSTDGWLDYLKTVPKVKVIKYDSGDLFSQFGQAGLQKSIARKNCSYPYMIHIDIDTFLVGIEKVQDLIADNPLVDDFPVRLVHFYGSFNKVNVAFEGSDPYQHTVMKNLPEIGVGRSWEKSDGAEFIYIEPGFASTYNALLGKQVVWGKYIRQSPLKLLNTPADFSYEKHEFALYHYGWCCRSLKTMEEKSKRQKNTWKKEWKDTSGEHVFLKENDERLINFKGEHPDVIKKLIAEKGGGWKFGGE